jgi:hypothetical protein
LFLCGDQGCGWSSSQEAGEETDEAAAADLGERLCPRRSATIPFAADIPAANMFAVFATEVIAGQDEELDYVLSGTERDGMRFNVLKCTIRFFVCDIKMRL